MTVDFKFLTAEQQTLFESNIEELIKDYNKIYDTVLTDMPDRIEDLVSNTVSRNINFNDSFYEFKCLSFIDKLKPQKGDVFIVYRRALQKCIYSKYPNVTVVLKNENNQSLIGQLIHYLFTMVHFVQCYLSKSKKRRNAFVKSRRSTLIDSFMHENSIEYGKYIDRYYCNMLDFVGKRDNFFYLLFFLPSPSAKKAKQVSDGSETNIIYFFDLLKIEDYIKALLSPFRRTKLKSVYKYNDFDITPIIHEKSSSVENYFMYGVLYYCFFKRAKEYGASISHFVDWFENQSHDKGIYYGLNKYFPEATVNAYVGFITNPDQTPHNIPTCVEINRGIAPRNIFLCNRWLTSIYKERAGCANCRPASFFRAARIWDIKREVKSDNTFSLLVPLSLNNEESIFKVGLLKKIHSCSNLKLQFFLKPHPDTPKVFINSIISGCENFINVVYGNVYDCLVNVDAMLATISTTIYEAAALGVPIIVLHTPENLYVVSIPKGFDKRLWIDINSLQNFNDEIKKIQKNGRDYYNEIGAHMKSLFFEPITSKSVHEILNIDEEGI